MRVVVLMLLLSGCSALSGIVTDAMVQDKPLVDADVQLGAENTNTESVVSKSDDKRTIIEDVTGGTINTVTKSSEAIVSYKNDDRVEADTVTGGLAVTHADRSSSLDTNNGSMVVQDFTVPWWAMLLAVVAGIFVKAETITAFIRDIRDIILMK